MNNDIQSLSNTLFEQIERINDDSLSEEDLEIALKKGKAIGDIAKTILTAADLSLKAKIHCDEYGRNSEIGVPLLGIKSEKE